MTSSLQIRSALVETLELGLVGPRNDPPIAHELLPQSPQRWYLTGYLIPKSADERSRSAGDDELDLEAAVSECLWHDHASLKVIHGYGSMNGASRIRPHVLHALQKHAERHGGKATPDGQNTGAHVLWFRCGRKFQECRGSFSATQCKRSPTGMGEELAKSTPQRNPKPEEKIYPLSTCPFYK